MNCNSKVRNGVTRGLESITQNARKDYKACHPRFIMRRNYNCNSEARIKIWSRSCVHIILGTEVITSDMRAPLLKSRQMMMEVPSTIREASSKLPDLAIVRRT